MKSIAKIYIMAVFGTKYRLGLIHPSWENHLYSVIGKTMNEMNGVQLMKIGGTADHVHILFATTGEVGEAEIVRKIKTESSMWVNKNRLCMGRFEWQRGGGRFSYSSSAIAHVSDYISRQKEHHAKMSFREEYEKFLQRFGVNYDKYDLPEDLIE